MASVAVGIVGYNDPGMLGQTLDAVMATVASDVPVFVYDDASWAANVRMISQRPESKVFFDNPWVDPNNPPGFYHAHIPKLSVIASPVNRGSAYGRNELWHAAEFYGIERMATIDMDMRVHPGWLDALMGVMDRHDDCGISTFTYCNDHGGRFPVTPAGQDLKVAETPSMCWLVRIAMLNDCLGPDTVWGMDTRMELFSHDSEFSQRMKRCSRWRQYLSPEPLISEFVQHHSVKTGNSVTSAEAAARRERDCKIWGEMNGKRGWEDGKTDV